MQKFTSVLLIMIVCVIFTNQSKAQLQVTNFSNLNDVYSLEYHNDTMWIGSTGGVVYRVLSNFNTAYILTKQTDGLGSNYITDIEVDNSGNKFFGSFDNGVTMYNAGAITIFNSTNSPINDRIFCLALDNNGNIWAGTPTGAYRFNGTTWDSFNTASEVPGEVRAIAADGNLIWFGTFGDGIYSYDIGNLNWTHETASDGNIVSDNITALVAKNDSLLIGTSLGITFYNSNGAGSWQTENIGNHDVYEVEFGASNDFLASTSDGLYRSFGTAWTKETGVIIPQGGNEATGVIETQNFDLWIGFNKFGGGVLPYNFSAGPGPYTISGSEYPGKNEITDIVSDNNLVYFSTPGNGLSTYDGNSWDVINSDMPSLNFNAMAMQADTLWLASDDNGAVRFFEGTWDNYPPIDPKVNGIAVDKNDPLRIWCGTSTGGVYSLYNRILENNFTTADGLLSAEIIAITVDSNNNVWFLHKNGASIYNGSTFSTITLADLGVNTAQLNDIDADLNGGVWIGSTEGVIEYNAGTITRYTTAEGLTENDVISVHVDQRNIKFFGTKNQGISILTNFGWQKIDKTNNILTDEITAIYYQDSRNLIWSAGKWGGISSTYIPPISVGAYVSPSNDFYCYDQPVTLSSDVTGGFGPGNYIYSWTSSDGTFTSTNSSETITPKNSINYALEVNDGYNGGSSSAFLDVVITDTSSINGPDTICPNGEIVKYTLSNTTAVNKTYTWSAVNGNIASDNTQSSIDVTWFTDRTNGSLILTEIDDNNCPVTQQFDVNIMMGAIPNIVLKNGERILICTDSGYVYQWYKDNIAIPGANRQFYYLNEQAGLVNGICSIIVP